MQATDYFKEINLHISALLSTDDAAALESHINSLSKN